MPEEAGRQNAGVIQHQEVSRPKKFRQVAENGVVDVTEVTIEMQHAGGGAIRQWLLGNQLLGQMKIEL